DPRRARAGRDRRRGGRSALRPRDGGARRGGEAAGRPGTVGRGGARTHRAVRGACVVSEPLHAFTVFTATFNRAHTLPRVYDSLRVQTLTDFEWLVVDDGSTDGTRELVAGWAAQPAFPIRYFHQENSGKHVAENVAVREAHGRFTATLDSDDWYAPDALESSLAAWEP